MIFEKINEFTDKVICKVLRYAKEGSKVSHLLVKWLIKIRYGM